MEFQQYSSYYIVLAYNTNIFVQRVTIWANIHDGLRFWKFDNKGIDE